MDDSTMFRDLVDPAFAAVHAGKPALAGGLALAEQAYGSAVRRSLKLTIDTFRENRGRAKASVYSLGVEDTATLRKGVRLLYALAD